MRVANRASHNKFLRRKRCASAILAVAAFVASAIQAHAQAIYAAGLESHTVQRIGLNGVVTNITSDLGDRVYDVTLDRYGNIYATVVNHILFVKIVRAGNLTDLISVAHPLGITTGPDGNVYVNTFEGTIYKVSPTGAKTVYATGMYGAFDMVFDKTGAMFVTREYSGADNGIYKITAPNTVQYVTYMNQPVDLAADSTGTVYITEWLAGNVYQLNSNNTISAYATGFKAPYGITFDGQNNMYVSEAPSDAGQVGPGTDQITEIAAGTHQRSILTTNLGAILGMAYSSEQFVTDTPEPGVAALLVSAGISAFVGLRRRRQLNAR